MDTTIPLTNNIPEAVVLMLLVVGVAAIRRTPVPNTLRLLSPSTSMVDRNNPNILSIVLAIPPSSPPPAAIPLSTNGIRITHMSLLSMLLLNTAPMLLRRCRLPTTIRTTPPRFTRTRSTRNTRSILSTPSRLPTNQVMDHSSHSSKSTASLMPHPHHTALPNRGSVTTLTLKVSTGRLAGEAAMGMTEAALEVPKMWAHLRQ
ncbi:hypothetical protein CH35J_009380 [Colletotrichum higginsianum]|uniref:Uncharacterized protein n=1 Tax=Colletotrichum higginsianum TaxID=80884 RepID=A0A4T0VMA0_9PEZI|nr:hypothetical protein CH35J_009380 [Colletotrichum higginsianum]